LLVETGDERSVSIRAIASAVGVSPPAVYLHFPDKESLILAVCSKQFEIFDAELEAAAARATDPVDELTRRSRAYVEFGLAHREAYRIMFMTHPVADEEQASTVVGAGRTAFQHLVDAVQRGIDAGVFRAVDPVEAAIGLWSGVHGVTSLLISLPSFPWPDVARMIELACAPHRDDLLIDGPG
ncbi:MAG TPA: TetR/AcrR family transcriptional regulator, partial [Acidimicrobiia bacterium]|nr:TetR/AcrR family transcriptional regulator [Acidimicrobiia bacterium]